MQAVKPDLTTNNLAAIHSLFNTAKKHDEGLKTAYDEGNKKDKGAAALNWYLSKITGE